MAVQALILAAGRGSRVNPGAAGTPKPLLEVGRRPLIDHLLETLADAGVGPVAMVVGFGADEIREIVGIRAEYVHNPRWATTNSLYSFSLARSWVTGPVMIFNCDLLLHPDIIDRLLTAGEDSIAFDSSSGDGREQMVVRFRDGSLIDMGKDLAREGESGENVGVVYLSAETARDLFDRTDGILAEGGEQKWLGAALRSMVRQRRLRGVDVAGLPWVEIDFPYDLERARKQVWPQIKSSQGRRPRVWRTLCWLMLASLLVLAAPIIKKGLFPPDGPELATVELTGTEQVQLHINGRTQVWSLFSVGQHVTTEQFGPGELRIDTRLILDPDQDPGDKTPYVIEISLNGKIVDWILHESKPSGSASFREHVIAKRERKTLQLPSGPQSVGIRFVASGAGDCLIRIRNVDNDPPD